MTPKTTTSSVTNKEDPKVGVTYSPDEVLREFEKEAMNIVHQIGDALSEAKATDFVGKRQETNDMCIDFTKNFLKAAYHAGEEAGRGKIVTRLMKYKTWALNDPWGPGLNRDVVKGICDVVNDALSPPENTAEKGGE